LFRFCVDCAPLRLAYPAFFPKPECLSLDGLDVFPVVRPRPATWNELRDAATFSTHDRAGRRILAEIFTIRHSIKITIALRG